MRHSITFYCVCGGYDCTIVCHFKNDKPECIEFPVFYSADSRKNSFWKNMIQRLKKPRYGICDCFPVQWDNPTHNDDKLSMLQLFGLKAHRVSLGGYEITDNSEIEVTTKFELGKIGWITRLVLLLYGCIKGRLYLYLEEGKRDIYIDWMI